MDKKPAGWFNQTIYYRWTRFKPPLVRLRQMAAFSKEESVKIVYIWIGPHSGSLIADAASLTAIDVDTGKNLLADNQKTGSLVHHNWFNTSPVDPNLASLITGGGRETWTNKRLAVINLQTQNVKVVSGPGQAVVSLAFSPSGDSLVYSAGPEEKNMYNGDTTDYAGKSRKVMMQRHLWVVKTDGGPVKQLTGDNSYRDEYPLWSAKGDYIFIGFWNRYLCS